MTRAQAAALAAAEDQAVDQPDDHVDDSNAIEKDVSTAPTDEPSEREALAELTTDHLDTNNHEDADAVPGEEVAEPEEKEEEHKEEEQTNGDAKSGAQIEDQGTSNLLTTLTISLTSFQKLPLHQLSPSPTAYQSTKTLSSKRMSDCRPPSYRCSTSRLNARQPRI